jgi:signal transduction histidine kinase
MNPFALSGISMGMLVLIKKPGILTNRLWAYFNFAMAFWGLGAYKVATAHDPQSALLWMKIGHIGVITIPVFFLHFSCRFFEKINKIVIIAAYLSTVFFLVVLLSNSFISSMKFIFHSFYYTTSPSLIYSIFFWMWVSSVVYAFYVAFSNIHNVSENKRNQMKYFLIITSVAYIGGIGNFLPIFGIMIYPYGNFAITLFIVITTYIILKYNLLDVNIVIRRSLIYSLLVTAITLIFLICVLISERLFHQIIHYQNIATSITMASLIALIFTPLKDWIQSLVDRSFFKATPIEMANQNEKLKTVAILASGLAHEIKNPLTPIKTFSEQLPYRLNDKEFLLKFSRIINKEVDRIDNLVQELLSFAKPSPLHLTKVNIHQLLAQILDFLNNETIRHKIKLNTSFENKNILISIDPKQIKQAFLNIFLNAIDAMPNGGTLTISTWETKQCFIITISDTGYGIEANDLSHIFDPFFSKKDHGTGLGLSITHEIIKNHNGKIFAESKLGEGTTFRIELPV